MACSSKTLLGPLKPLKPLAYHIFPPTHHLPYHQSLQLQNDIIKYRLANPDEEVDLLLLLEHSPTYTTGRRDSTPQSLSRVLAEESRLKHLGADWAVTKRGGQVTYHGPGQVVGYGFFDLAHQREGQMSTKCYVSHLQTLLFNYAKELTGDPKGEIQAPHKDGHVGVFGSETTKLSSIGIHLSHRLTSHGFSLNVTDEPLRWFEEIIACGLPEEIKATSLEAIIRSSKGDSSLPPPSVSEVCSALVGKFEEMFRPAGEGVQSLYEMPDGGGGLGNIVRKFEESLKNDGGSSTTVGNYMK